MIPSCFFCPGQQIIPIYGPHYCQIIVLWKFKIFLLNAKFFNIFTMKKSIDFFYFFVEFLNFIIINQNICFLFIYVNLLFHINFLWIMWITLCITQISRFFNLSKMWITFTPFFALSTFSPIIRQALCNLLFVRFYSTFFSKQKSYSSVKLQKL